MENHSHGEYAAEARPFESLDELYNELTTLKPWPAMTEIRETAEYVYCGAECLMKNERLPEKLERDKQPKTLVCHDMKGGYLEDRFILGSASPDAYLFYHWSTVDIFVYFSHHFITVPPRGWICAAHSHGVKVLGTLITEGGSSLTEALTSRRTVRRFVDALVRVTKYYKFDGWLLNVEISLSEDQVERLLEFVKLLTERIHEEVDGSEVIWYDSVTKDGKLKWQNELNETNKDFFLACDGIYLNYNWTETHLSNSHRLAMREGRHPRDVYVGLDVWGRGCPGGGGFNSRHALEKIREQNLSVAIFAPGWTHEYFGPETFPILENLFWAQLFPLLFVHLPIYEDEPFRSSFCRGRGLSYYKQGEVQLDLRMINGKLDSAEKRFYNLALQQPQLSVVAPELAFVSQSEEILSEDDDNSAEEKHIKVNTEDVRRAHAAVSSTVIDGANRTINMESSAEVHRDNENAVVSKAQENDEGREESEVSDSNVHKKVEKEEKNKKKKTIKRFVYETKGHIITILKDKVEFESKRDVENFNSLHFCETFSYEGGGCLKVTTKNTSDYHRLFLVHCELPTAIEASVVFVDADPITANAPTLVLGNDSNLVKVQPYKIERINSTWKRGYYGTDLRTIQEVGVAFPRDGVVYLGEISLDKRQRII